MKKIFIFCFVLFFIIGCSASIGSYERGLWFDDDVRGDRETGFGIKADIIAGQSVRPFGGWDNPDHVWKFPIIAPFISVAFNDYGFYLGWKSFKNHKGRYDWLPSDADPNNPEILFTPSASMRRTRRK